VQRLGLSKSALNPVAAEKSIPVLPFEYLCNDKANAYFAEGIQDEILTRLSKIADLKVISRTSTQHYESAPVNLPEIAKQLGVAHILEEECKRAATLRVNIQLIKAAHDSHLWADTFDRKLTDIFSVESEVAKTIVDQLRVKLTGEDEQVIAPNLQTIRRCMMPTCVAWLLKRAAPIRSISYRKPPAFMNGLPETSFLTKPTKTTKGLQLRETRILFPLLSSV
jgi:TolB-like protein